MMSQTHFQPPTQTVSWVSELLNVIALAKIKHQQIDGHADTDK